ncbi:MAG: SET domain-containing protein [Chitinophagaceae bacterium]|nr:MAG: SET domain-containing protein [Chitinophagaceae bacterium]
MAISPGSLVVRKSTIPGSGNGLFTKKLIPAGTRIIEYKGKVTTWKDADHEDGDNAYIYFVKRTHVIDARKNKKWLARFANDAKGLTRVKGITNNCEYVEENTHVYIHAKKDIPAGGEILVPYGPEYWQVIRYNKKLAAKELRDKTRAEKATADSAKKAAEKSSKRSAKKSSKKFPDKTGPKSTRHASGKSQEKSPAKTPLRQTPSIPLQPAKTHRTVQARAKRA